MVAIKKVADHAHDTDNCKQDKTKEDRRSSSSSSSSSYLAIKNWCFCLQPVRENCKLRYNLLISRLICKISDFNLLIRRYEVSYRNS